MAQAAVPSIADTSWDLTGKFSGRATGSCKFGGRFSKPIKAESTVFKGIINFEDGAVTDDGEGVFSWQDQTFSPVPITGTWKQNGAKFTLKFENWFDSPMTTLPQFDQYLSLAGVDASVTGFEPARSTFGGTINARGTVLKISESMGFKFNSAASAIGSSNSCSFSLTMGRNYVGKPPVQ
jgi:hypothetical protein